VIDRSPSFGEMWRGLADRQRVTLRNALRERAEPFTQSDGTIVARTQALGAVAFA
jgi:hypothetical protein